MKIGILTFHRCINYGSYWQAKCLASGLTSMGHEVEILDHYSRRVNYAEWKCALQPVLPTPVPATDYSLYKQKVRSFFRLFEELPLSKPFCLDNPATMDQYDMVVVGSDEVWNLAHPWYGYKPIFYGDGIRAARLISYAASFGNYHASWNLEKEWAARLLNFNRISVRDENSQLLVKNSTGIEPEIVLDPCLQFPPEYSCKNPSGSDYVAVYGHNFTPGFIRLTRQWANENRVRLISVGYRNEWAHEQWITAGPHDFAGFIQQSAAVITNFFHGCIFALLNARPFVCETTPYRSHKISGLLKMLHAGRYLVNESTTQGQFHELITMPTHNEVFIKLAGMRKRSGAFLHHALLQCTTGYNEQAV